MSRDDGDRSRHFPAIENQHGLSGTHAKALVMIHRGSATSKRHRNREDVHLPLLRRMVRSRLAETRA